jgi:hypothetical protein
VTPPDTVFTSKSTPQRLHAADGDDDVVEARAAREDLLELLGTERLLLAHQGVDLGVRQRPVGAAAGVDIVLTTTKLGLHLGAVPVPVIDLVGDGVVVDTTEVGGAGEEGQVGVHQHLPDRRRQLRLLLPREDGQLLEGLLGRARQRRRGRRRQTCRQKDPVGALGHEKKLLCGREGPGGPEAAAPMPPDPGRRKRPMCRPGAIRVTRPR